MLCSRALPRRHQDGGEGTSGGQAHCAGVQADERPPPKRRPTIACAVGQLDEAEDLKFRQLYSPSALVTPGKTDHIQMITPAIQDTPA